MTTYLVRPARPGDLAGVRNLWRAIRREYRVASSWSRDGIGGEAGELWVVEAGRGEIVGSCGLREGEDGLWEVHSLNLAPEWRGFGLGRVLIEQAIHDAQEQGALALAVSVPRELGDAGSFLLRLGFVEDPAPGPDEPSHFLLVLAQSH
ncbi:MAG: GNAT family N-acetyltransferase [Thermoanaerobaculaceae bacterium]|jgi:GNAT superfamily N-acetyltransferase|nr:GNAT family N-acetyltransferase [Thermoanaerobaculaceae bacterium]